MSAPATTPKTFVVGIDSSLESADAVTWARTVAGPDDRILAVHAWDIPSYVTAMVPEATFPLDFELAAKAVVDEALKGIDDPRIEVVLRRGIPGRALVAVAQDGDAVADTIVVGHRGDGRVSMMLGSVANYVVHHARIPVVVVRGERETVPRRVVVGVDATQLDDGTNPSVRALQWVYSLPGVEEVRVIHAWFIPPLAVGLYATPIIDVNEFELAATAEVKLVLDAAGPPPAGVAVVTDVVQDAPGRALRIASQNADLVAVGSRGRGGFKGLLLGSTSAEVAAHADAPVAIIR